MALMEIQNGHAQTNVSGVFVFCYPCSPPNLVVRKFGVGKLRPTDPLVVPAGSQTRVGSSRPADHQPDRPTRFDPSSGPF